MSEGRIAGVELGGTKCVCTIADASGRIMAQQVVPTTTADETLGGIESILSGWWSERPFLALGIASFGPVDLDRNSPTWGYITTTTKPEWPETDVAGRIGRRFDVPISFDTDVNGAALAEMRWGAAQGLNDFAYITVGTGVGVGLIANGKSMRGFAHTELGHIRVPRLPGDNWGGACSYHGDCVEGLASGSAIRERLGARNFAEVSAEDPIWDTAVHALVQLCHVLVCAAAPHRIAIGGGVMDKQPHLLARIEPLLVESIAAYMELPNPGSYVTAPGLGDRAGPLGPIAMALDAAAG